MPGSTRDEFLGRVRRATAQPVAPHQHDSGIVSHEAGRFPVDAPLADIFEERATAAAMHIHRVDSDGKVATAIAEVAATEGISRLTIQASIIDRYGISSNDLLVVEPWDASTAADEQRERAFGMECGVTDVDCAIAETGSLVLAGTSDRGRSLSLLGRVHIAVVREDQIIADLYDLVPRLQELFPDGMPPNVNVITGPSKTADIELSLVVGVHGPGVVHIIMVAS